MVETDLALVEKLCDENPRFRKLYEEHSILERQLDDLDQHAFLSPEQEVERKKVQKLKLAGKDEMESILRSYRQ
ncbi:MAG TPA: DUF465 domain-containing protein [Geothermobacteraceae bacterium]|nr:DUF465 domain-containing protein [Geothermobacteraceae bacterium]